MFQIVSNYGRIQLSRATLNCKVELNPVISMLCFLCNYPARPNIIATEVNDPLIFAKVRQSRAEYRMRKVLLS